MFRTRFISGIALIALALLFIITGGPVLAIVTCAISLIGMFELYRVLRIEKSAMANTGYLACVAYYLNLYFGWIQEKSLIYIAFLVVLLAIYVFAYPREASRQIKFYARDIMGAFFGFFYVAVCLSYIYQTRSLASGGAYLVWLIFLCSWGADTSAYAVGMLIGKHKMAPVLSPKKSIEGAVGGLVGSALFTGIYSYLFRNQLAIDSKGIVILALSAAIGALISMVGDLAASAIKRNYEIKDYGKLIPGHGGILDRFDSVIITAPIIFYLVSSAL